MSAWKTNRRLFAALAWGATVSVASAQPFDPQQIQIIKDTAASICNAVKNERGNKSGVEIEGEVKAKLGAFFDRFADVGGSTKIKGTRQEFENISQEAVSGDSGCRERVFDKMFDKLSAISQPGGQTQGPSEAQLIVVASTAERICGVVKDQGSASSAGAQGAVSVELRGLASQIQTTGGQNSGSITTNEYVGLVRDQVGPLMKDLSNCRLEVFKILVSKIAPGGAGPPPPPTFKPPPPQPASRTRLSCQTDQIIDWLDQHGIYGNRPFDGSVYDDRITWTVNGKQATKTKADIVKEEDDFRKVYPMQRYTPTSSSVTRLGDQCVLTQQIDGYKQKANGSVQLSNYRFEFGIKTDGNGPRIVDRQTDVLSGRH